MHQLSPTTPHIALPAPPPQGLVGAVPALLLIGIFGCGQGDTPNSIRAAFAEAPKTEVVTGPTVALRFSTADDEGVRIYVLPELTEVDWRFPTPNLVTSELVGYAAAEDQIYLRTDRNKLVALDLRTGRTAVLDTLVSAATLGPTDVPHLIRSDSIAGVVLERRAEHWDDTLPEIPARIWGTTGGRLVTLFENDRGRQLALASNGRTSDLITIPGGQLAVSPWGEALAFLADAVLTTIETSSGLEQARVTFPSILTATTFSTAGHRIYVATAAGDLHITDRHPPLTRLASYRLPAAATALRTGPSGRFLMMKPATGDSVWIADMVDFSGVTGVQGSWDEDLPAITVDGTLLVRQEDDIVAADPGTGAETGRIADAAADRWVAIQWNPQRPELEVESEGAREPTAPTGQLVYVQLASTANESWAQARVDELRAAQLNALLLYPTAVYDRYRVVLGPYETRDQADAIGRRLGEPYWVFFQRDTTTANR